MAYKIQCAPGRIRSQVGYAARDPASQCASRTCSGFRILHASQAVGSLGARSLRSLCAGQDS
ncbi:MAG: hypothetical protein AAB722_01675, partial [Patescibacteria group bacterium]